MPNDQGRTLQTVGELKQAINQLPDDNAKLSLSSDQSMSGILLQQEQGRVTFSQGQQAGGQGRSSS